jgi:hypothetical protein
MARSYANILTAIWREKDFINLDAPAQHCYLLLVTQSDISAAGTLALTPQRWAKLTKGQTARAVSKAIETLAAARFVIVDRDTEELLVRSFIRHDKGYGNIKRRGAIRDAVWAIASPIIRGAVAHELNRLGLADMASELTTDTASDRASHVASDRASDGHTQSGRVVVTKPTLLDPTTHNPQTATRIPSHSTEPADAPRRATRIEPNYQPPPGCLEWATTRGIPAAVVERETEKFRNYWQAKSGRDATKHDWPATWRNWLIRAQEHGTSPPPTTNGATHKANTWLTLAKPPSAPAIEGTTP